MYASNKEVGYWSLMLLVKLSEAKTKKVSRGTYKNVLAKCFWWECITVDVLAEGYDHGQKKWRPIPLGLT